MRFVLILLRKVAQGEEAGEAENFPSDSRLVLFIS
jgi:hypothetical protein